MEYKNIKEPQYPYASEPAVAYGNRLWSLVLGDKDLKETTPSEATLIALTRTGIAKSSLKHLAYVLGVTMEELSAYLHSSYRNIQRKKEDEILDVTKTEKVLELTTFAQKGIDVFGSRNAFAQWLQSPLIALNGQEPRHLLDTTFGITLLSDMLGRIEHGIFS